MTTIGYAAADLDVPPKGLLARFGKPAAATIDETETTNRVTSLVRRATLGRLTLPCETDSVERALVVVAGPPAAISRRGVERARAWLEEETGTMEVRGGDYPVPDSGHVAAVVVLSGVYDVPRIRELQRLAIEARESFAERDRGTPAALADLLSTAGLETPGVVGDGGEPDDRLQPLF